MMSGHQDSQQRPRTLLQDRTNSGQAGQGSSKADPSISKSGLSQLAALPRALQGESQELSGAQAGAAQQAAASLHRALDATVSDLKTHEEILSRNKRKVHELLKERHAAKEAFAAVRRRYLDEELKGQTLSEEMAHADHTLRTKKEEVRLLHQEVAELEAKKDKTMHEIQRANKAFLVDAEQMDAHLSEIWEQYTLMRQRLQQQQQQQSVEDSRPPVAGPGGGGGGKGIGDSGDCGGQGSHLGDYDDARPAPGTSSAAPSQQQQQQQEEEEEEEQIPE